MPLLGLRLAVLLLVIFNIPGLPSVSERFHEIATSAGVPYRDFPVEYPIGELALIKVIGPWAPDVARTLLALVAFAADIVAFAAIRAGWGKGAARRYLVLGLPLLLFIYRRADLASVALAVLGLALLERKREKSGGATLAVATLVKLWPGVLLPAVFIRRRFQGAWTYAITLAAGMLVWVVIGGPSAISQVVTFRGSTGWEVESTVGTIVWAATGEQRFEQGAARTGSIPSWFAVATVLLLLTGLGAIWRRAAIRGLEPAGAPALAAVAMLLVTSSLLSPGYMAWLLPWGAIASERQKRWAWLTFVPCLLTAVLVAKWNLLIPHLRGQAWSQALLLLRNLSLLAILLGWLFAGSGTPSVVSRAVDVTGSSDPPLGRSSPRPKPGASTRSATADTASSADRQSAARPPAAGERSPT